jgi:hypothetical protein
MTLHEKFKISNNIGYHLTSFNFKNYFPKTDIYQKVKIIFIYNRAFIETNFLIF